jgi:hypothetical protein
MPQWHTSCGLGPRPNPQAPPQQLPPPTNPPTQPAHPALPPLPPASTAFALWPSPQRLAAAAAPALAWDGALTPEGSFDYKWALTKTVSGGTSSGDEASTSVKVQKGLTQDITYTIVATRSVDTASVKAYISGALTITNVNAAAPNFTGVLTVKAVTLTTKSASGATSAVEAPVTVACSPPLPAALQPGGVTRCAFSKAAYPAYPDAGLVAASVDFDDANSDPPAAPPATSTSPVFNYDSITGQFASAMLTDKVDSSPIDTLYKGFTGYTLDAVWRATDPSAAVPAAGVLITSDRAEYRWGAWRGPWGLERGRGARGRSRGPGEGAKEPGEEAEEPGAGRGLC